MWNNFLTEKESVILYSTQHSHNSRNIPHFESKKKLFLTASKDSWKHCALGLFCASDSPGYFPPLFLWMKQIMRRIRMSRAMAHMRPMNHPWVAMSTCRLVTAGQRWRDNAIFANAIFLQSFQWWGKSPSDDVLKWPYIVLAAAIAIS